LVLHPSQGFRKQYPRFLSRCTPVFLQFGTQGPNRTAAAGYASRFLILMSTKAAVGGFLGRSPEARPAVCFHFWRCSVQ
jgi:hypothetical protein